MAPATDSEAFAGPIAAIIRSLLGFGVFAGRRPRRLVFYYVAKLLQRQHQVSHAKFFVSAGLSHCPDHAELNDLNVALSRAGAAPERDDSDLVGSVTTCCTILGAPGSGHTLLAALLDAHPAIAISNDLNIAKQLAFEPSRETLLRMIVEQARTFAFNGWYWQGRSHGVAGQWQGSYNAVTVIGDKLSPGRAMISEGDPGSFWLIEQRLSLPMKVIHIYRNPFDSIAEMAGASEASMGQLMEDHFTAVEAISSVKFERPQDTIFDLSYEHLLEDPRGCLAVICEFLNLPASSDYLEGCARVLTDLSERSRAAINWTEHQKTRAQRQLEIFPWLEHYSFDQ